MAKKRRVFEQGHRRKLMVVVDESPEVAQQFNVMNIPSILAFEGGELKQRIVGAMPKAKLVELIAKHL